QRTGNRKVGVGGCRRRRQIDAGAAHGGPAAAEGSAEIAARVAAAHKRKRLRFTDQEIRVNAEADGTFLEEITAPTTKTEPFLTWPPIA
ncbi:MAG: hypothetical protein VXW49_08750, partial [Pseudomonadota bacterium]|nr:hypothetical protein [Pseudomonadota bacterium]